MKIPKQKRLAIRLTAMITIGLFCFITVLIVLITLNINRELKARELDKLELLADQNARIAKDFMETMLHKQDVIISTVQSLDNIPQEERTSILTKLLTDVKAGEEDILSLFYVSEPNVLMEGTPDGYSIFATAKGTQTAGERFLYVNESVYQSVKDSKNMTIADPFTKVIDGTQYAVITVLQPIVDSENRIVGMVGSNIDTELLGGAPYNHGDYSTFNTEIVCGHKTVIMNSRDQATVGKPYASISTSKNPEQILSAASNADSLIFLDSLTNGSRNYRACMPFYVGSSTTPWLSVTSITQKEFNQQIISQLSLMIAISVIGLLLLYAFCYFTIHKTLDPLEQVEAGAKRLSEGNLHMEIPVHTDDDIGRLAKSLNESVGILSSYVVDIDHAMGEMSKGNFNVQPSKPFIGDLVGIERSITEFIVNMSKLLRQIDLAADNVSSSSGQVAASSSILSSGASEQASSVEQLTATIIQLSEDVNHINDQAQQADITVRDAGGQLTSSNEKMADMKKAMRDITESSSQIQKIIKTIEDIAFQTNILALNAAVEAARAGEAGKGFAVVADEVGNLAAKSSEAAKNTTAMIQQSIQSVEYGATVADEAATSLEGVIKKADAVVAIVDEITSAIGRQRDKISQISAGAEQISSIVETNSATAEETAASAQELASQSKLLKDLAAGFQLPDDPAITKYKDQNRQ